MAFAANNTFDFIERYHSIVSRFCRLADSLRHFLIFAIRRYGNTHGIGKYTSKYRLIRLSAVRRRPEHKRRLYFLPEVPNHVWRR